MSATDPVLALLGLAARARAVVTGTDRVKEAARSGGVRFVVLAADASANARQKLVPLLAARRVPYVTAFERSALGAAVGRSPLSAVGLTGESFAARVRDLLGAGADVGRQGKL